MITKKLLNTEQSEIRKIFNMASKDSINLGIGEPDFNTPQHIIDACKDALDRGITSYVPNMGIPELTEAVSEKLKNDNNLDIPQGNIMITCGASEAIMLSIMAFAEKGDEVIVPNPGFVSYKNMTQIAEAKPVDMNLKYENNFKIDLDELNENINKNTKCIVHNSPSNPLGTVSSKEEIKGLAQIAEDNDIIIISDEIYEKIIYGKKHYSPANYTDNCIVINGFSKAYAMTGWRLGYMAVNENLNAKYDVLDHILKIHQFGFACATSFAQYGAVEALKGNQQCVKDMVKEFEKRRDLIYNGLKDKFDVIKPEGAFYIFPDVSEYGNGMEIAEKLIKNGVLCVPGRAFGSNGKNNVRFSYATKYEDIEKALEIIDKII
ncbi:pyridoxal phosphate-dependent aminotransferase [Methanococcus voltae]|uniref:Aminotransferase n=1 Tax=Methanococcus voltae (strain ATCC BAA-1334 / A3) TaxID=456320 RepID=D7DTF7_METV3|nr:pyridoxal phosphate-dependent aminotransferase [Methanococcus voltae]MCS3901269.1 aspartate aminotransferase [Methanococcus voltae]